MSLASKLSVSFQSLWVVSHSLTIGGFIAYVFIQFFQLPSTVYYILTLLGASMTYSLVLSRTCTQGVSMELDPKSVYSVPIIPLSELLRSECFHLLVFSILFLVTTPTAWKMAPFVIFSTINISDFLLCDVFPTKPLSQALLPLLRLTDGPALLVASYLDLVNFAVLFYYDLEHNYYALLIYTITWMLRFESSELSRAGFYSLLKRLDQHNFPGWKKIRSNVALFLPLPL